MAARLAGIAGLQLDDWQRHVLDVGLAYHPRTGKHLAFEACVIVARQNGKGSILEALELWALFGGAPQVILHSAHEYKTANEAFLRIKGLIESSPLLMEQVAEIRTANGEQGIRLHNGSRLRFVARSKGSGRGFSVDLVILDEAYALNPEQMAALLPTLSSKPNPQLWYTSSAGMVDSITLTSVRDRGVKGDDPALAYLEWSCPPDADPASPASWAQANPALGGRISHEFVEREQRSLPEEEFGRERLSVWGSVETTAIIPAAHWSTLARDAQDKTELTSVVSFGLDVAPDRQSAAIAVAALREDGLQQLEVLEHRVGTGWVAERLVELAGTWGPIAVVLDPGGPAGSQIPALTAAGVELQLISVRQLGQACGLFYDHAIESAFRHLDDPVLTGALMAAKKRPLGDAWAWARREKKSAPKAAADASPSDISPLYAATLAKHGLDGYLAEGIDPADNVW